MDNQGTTYIFGDYKYGLDATDADLWGSADIIYGGRGNDGINDLLIYGGDGGDIIH